MTKPNMLHNLHSLGGRRRQKRLHHLDGRSVNRRGNCFREPKRRLQIALLQIIQPELRLHRRRRVRQRLAVHVVYHRRQQQQAADVPFPSWGAGVCGLHG